MKLAVVGSRSLYNTQAQTLLSNTIDDIREYAKVEEIITGGASGIDVLAIRYATIHSIPYKVITPDYNKHGKYAPLIRNKQIVDECDKLVAIWDGHSTGTSHTVKLAMKQKKLIKVQQVV